LKEKEDRDAYLKCTTAKGAWVSSKGDASKIVEALNAETQKELEKAR